MSGMRARVVKVGRRGTSIVSIAAMVMALLTVVGVQNAAAAGATTWYVNGPGGGSDTNSCTAAASACATIGGALAKAGDGDKIVVAAGTYDEAITVDKAVSLVGANAGKDARASAPSPRTPGGSGESIIDASGTPTASAVTITANGASIDGFELKPGASSQDAVHLRNHTTGNTVSNNIIHASQYAVGMNTDGTTLDQNRVLLAGNSVDGFLEQSGPGGNWTVTDNSFELEQGATLAAGGSHYGADINYSGDPSNPAGQATLTITGNSSTSTSTIVAVTAATGVTIKGNTSTGAAGSAILIGGSVTTATVEDNTVTGATTGLNFYLFGGYAASSGVTVSGNQFVGNTTAVRVNAGAYDGTPDVSHNWWGSAGGPTSASIAPDSGAVTYSPWCTDASCTNDSTGGAVRYVGTTNASDSGNDCSSSGSPCATIQHAIDVALPGDTVRVAAGTYHQQVVVTKPISLVGAGAGSTTIDGTGLDQHGTLVTGVNNYGVVYVGALSTSGTVSISGFTITGPAAYAYSDGQPEVIALADAAAGDTIEIADNTIDAADAAESNGINGFKNNATTDIHNNTVTGAWQGILLEDNGPATIKDNTFTGLISYTDGTTTYSGQGVRLISDLAGNQPDQTITGNTFSGYAGVGVKVSAGYALGNCSTTPCDGSLSGTISDNTFGLTGGQPGEGAIMLQAQNAGNILDMAVTGNTGFVSSPLAPVVQSPGSGTITATASGNAITVGPDASTNQVSIDFTPPTQVVANGQPVAFGGVVHNNSTSTIPNARYDITLSGISGLTASQITLQYEHNGTWVTAPLTDNGSGGLSGYLEDVAGFSLPQGGFTMNLQVSFATGTPSGTLTGTATLVQVAADGTPINVLTGAVSHTTDVTTLTVPGCSAPLGSGTLTPADFDPALSDTRKTGHYAALPGGGLRVWTQGTTSTDKVAEYVSLGANTVPLGQVGAPSLDLTNNMPGQTPPGYQLMVNNGDSATPISGILVYEPAFYGDGNWWSNKDFKIGAGGGYPSMGTLSDYLNRWPNAYVTGYGFSLGSGVLDDSTLNSITFACTVYAFQAGTLGSVTGTVTDAAGHGLDNVTVTASVTDGTTVLATASATSGADGTYTINGLPASNSYLLRFDAAHASGGDSQTGYLNATPTTAITVASAASTNAGSQPLPAAPGSLSGTVTRSGTSTGLAGVAVTATGPGASTATQGTTTDGSGAYTLPGLTAGTYSVTFHRAGFGDETDASVSVTDGVITTLDVGLLQQANTVSGVVTDSTNSHALAGARVVLKDPTTLAWLQTTASDANGAYVFGSVSSGTAYIVCFWNAGYTATCSATQTMTIGGQQTADAALVPVTETSVTATPSGHPGWTNDPDPTTSQAPAYVDNTDTGHAGLGALNFTGAPAVDYYHGVPNLPLDQVSELSVDTDASDAPALVYQLRIYGALNTAGTGVAADNGFATLYTTLPATTGGWQHQQIDLAQAQWVSTRAINGQPTPQSSQATLAQIAQSNPKAVVVMYGLFRGSTNGSPLSTDALVDDISFNGAATNFENTPPPAPVELTSTGLHPNGWVNDNAAPTYAFGPAGADGVGSLDLSVGATGGHVDWFHSIDPTNTSFTISGGTPPTIPLAGIGGLGMKIYVGSGGVPPAFQLRIVGASAVGNPSATAGTIGYAALNWETAYNTGVPAPDSHGWITLSQLENGKWWSTRAINGLPNVQSSTATLAEIAIANPQAVIYAYGVGVGGIGTASTDYADDVTFNGTTTNFEPDVVTIAGTVTAAGAPLAGVKVTVRTSTDTWAVDPNSVTTGADGQYSITDLPGDTYSVCFVKAGYQANCQSVPGTPGSTSTANADLTPVAATTNTSTPMLPNGWANDPDGTVPPVYAVVAGADHAGALNLHTTPGATSTDRAISYYHLANPTDSAEGPTANGIPLDQVTEAGMSQNTASAPDYASVYQLRVYGATAAGGSGLAADSGWTTLTWFPQTLASGWNAEPIDLATATWGSTRAINGLAGGYTAFATLADIVAHNPSARVVSYGVFRGSTAGGYPDSDSFVDDVSFNGVTTDFEPVVPPTATTDVATVTAPNGWANDPGGTVAPIYTPLTDGDGNGAIDLQVATKIGDGSTQDPNTYASSYYRAANAADPAAGLPLSQISEMGYQLKTSGIVDYAPVYQLRICAGGIATGGSCTGFATLVWQPTSVTGSWQTESLDPVTATWWSTKPIAGFTATGPGGTELTLPQIIAANPDAVVTAYGVFRGSTSGNYPSGDAYVDDVSFNGVHTDFQAIDLNTCTSTSFDAADPAAWDFSQTRSGGHYAFLPNGGLHVWTDSNTTNDKVAGYLTGLHIPLADMGAVSMPLSSVTGVAPGINLFLDNGVTGTGHLQGYIVNEPTAPGSGYGDNWWAANYNGAPVDWDLGMFVGGGGSATTNAPLAAYLNRWPDAFVTQVGFSLGSGVQGNAVIDSITAHCTTTYPIPAASTVTSTPLVTLGWAPDPDGTVGPQFVAGDGSPDGTGSLNLHVNSAADDGGNANTRASSYYQAAGGIPLTEALTMGYSEKLGATDPAYRTVYQLRINGAIGGGTGGFTTLIWVPTAGTDAGNGWTTYSIDPATAKWVSTRAINGVPGGQAGPGMTLAEIQALNPGATITQYGVFRGSTSGNYPTGDAYVDGVVLNAVTTDFEPLGTSPANPIISRPSAPNGWAKDPDSAVTAPSYVANPNAAVEDGHTGVGSLDFPVGPDNKMFSYFHVANPADTTAGSTVVGVPLGNITDMSYATRTASGDLPVYQLILCGTTSGINPTGCDGWTVLVWTPTIGTSSSWQTATIDPATSQWWSTHALTGLTAGAETTLPQIIANNPGAVVAAYGVFRGNSQGTYTAVTHSYVDDIDFNGTVTDFEPDVAAISGTVTSAATGATVGGATVTVTVAGGSSPAASVTGATTGSYSVAGLPVGSAYQVCVSATGYQQNCVTSASLVTAGLTVDVALVPAHLPTVSVDLPATVTVGASPVSFTGTIANPADGLDYPHSRLDFTITGPSTLTAADLTVQYPDGAGGWATIPLAGTGGTLTGQYGPTTGFDVAPGYNVTTPFRVSAASGAPVGALSVTTELVTLDSSNAPLFTLATDTDASALVAQPTLSVTLPGYLIAGEDWKQFTGTIANPADGTAYGNVRYDITLQVPAAVTAADLAVQYQSGSSWLDLPLADGPAGSDTVTGYFGPLGGFALGTGVTTTTTFRVKVSAGTAPGAVTATNTLDTVEASGDVVTTLVTATAGTTIVAAPSISLAQPAAVTVGAQPVTYTGTLTNPSAADGGMAFSPVRYDFTLTVPAGMTAAELSLQYFETADGQWHDLPLTDGPAGSDTITGYFGPNTGFAVAAGADNVSQFRIAVAANAPTGTITTDAELVLLSGTTPVETLATTQAVTTVYAAPSMSIGFPATLFTGAPPTDFSGTTTNPSSAAIPGSRYDVTLSTDAAAGLAAGDLVLEYQTSDSVWHTVPLTAAGGTLTGWFGPQDGFPLLPGDSITQFRVAATASAPAGTVTTTVDLVQVDGSGNALATLATASGRTAIVAGKAALSGTVTDPHGNPLQHVGVALYQAAAPNNPVGSTVYTAADGTYSLTGLDAGSYFLCFGAGEGVTGGTSQTGYYAQCWNDQPVTSPTTLVLGPSSSTTADATLAEQLGWVTGVVKDAVTGDPVSGASVVLGSSTVTTGADGTYTFTGVADGAVSVGVTKPGYAPATVAATAATGTIVTKDVSLQPLPGSISGTVYATDGTSPIPGATVTVVAASGASQTAITDGSGLYSVGSLQGSSSYTVCVVASGSVSQCLTGAYAVQVGPGEAVTQDFTLRALTASSAVSRPSAPDGWFGDTPDTAVPAYVVNPTYQPEAGHDGLGSLSMDISTKPASSWWHWVGAQNGPGIPLSQVSQLSYAQQGTGAVAYELVLCNTTSGDHTAAGNGCDNYARIVFNGPAASGTWGTVSVNPVTAQWWATRNLAGGMVKNDQSTTQSLAQIVANNPDATVIWYGVFRGSTSGPTSTDQLRVDDVSFNGAKTDFEPDVATTTLSAINDDQAISALASVSLTVKTADGSTTLYSVADNTSSISGDTATVTTPNVPVGSYQVCITGTAADGHLLVPADGNACDAVSVTLAGPNSFTVHLKQERGSISGTVTGGGNALSGVTVTLKDAGGVAVGSPATTGADGKYSFQGLIAGSYSVTFTDGSAWQPLTKTGVAVTQGANTTVDAVLLTTAATISGTVTAKSGGAGLKNVVVAAYASGNGALVKSAATAADGTYTLTGLPAGPYVLCFNASGATGGTAVSGYVSVCGVTVVLAVGATQTVNQALVGARPAVVCDPSRFVDVPGGIFCADITWLAGSGITQGTDATHFSPASNVLRAQMALFLYRLSTGSQVAPSCTKAPFVDVPQTSLACGAIKWLVDHHITTGVDATHFNPGGNVTRGQMALFLYRLVTGNQSAPACTAAPQFVDVPQKSLACGAIKWLVDNHITNGVNATHFDPAGTVRRAEMAAFLHRTADLTALQGTVTGAGSAGVKGVSVVITGTGSTTAAYSTVTGGGGTYAVPDIKAGTYTVCFDASAASGLPATGYAYQCYDDVIGGGSPGAVTVTRWHATTVNATLAAPLP